MNKPIIIHIHTDKKFIKDSLRFEGNVFVNKSVFIGEKFSDTIGVEGTITFFSKEEIKDLVAFCSQAELVVLYDLDIFKSRLALQLPIHIKIAWRFFGYELYSRKKNAFLSEHYFKLFKEERSVGIKDQVMSLLRDFKSLLSYRATVEGVFLKAIKRIDYMLVLCIEEYEFLQKYFPNLPEGIKLPNKRNINTLFDVSVFDKKKLEKRVVVLGNNRSVYNNHLEMIEIVKNNKSEYSHDFKLLFNYGTESKYSHLVVKKAKEAEIDVIDQFMTFGEFSSFYQSISALCINGYRQMAVANIMMGFEQGVKVYLNDKNVYYKWLLNEGFQVYSMEDFKYDIKVNNIFLNSEIAKHNAENIVNLTKKYSVEKFQDVILEKFKK